MLEAICSGAFGVVLQQCGLRLGRCSSRSVAQVMLHLAARSDFGRHRLRGRVGAARPPRQYTYWYLHPLGC